MASILELALQEKISTHILVAWSTKQQNVDIPACLQDLVNVKQEFIPFFLNYLRDHTIHLIQSSKSATPSPAKTPSLKKLQKSVKRNGGSNRKRQQLFGASPAGAGDMDDLRNFPSSVFSPDTSIDSPGYAQINHKGDMNRNHMKNSNQGNYASQKCSPQCGSQRLMSQQTPEQRSKQKLTLAEFVCTPDQSNNSGSYWRKKSPHPGNRSKDIAPDTTPSPVITNSRRSGSKKRHSYSPLVQNDRTGNVPVDSSNAPVFSLTNSHDFPPMGQSSNKKNSHKRRSLDSNINLRNTFNCDTKISRAINFSNNNSNDGGVLTRFAQERLKNVQRVSPVTVQSSTPGPRRITPTVVKADNSAPQNSAFLVAIEENSNGQTSDNAKTSEIKNVTDTLQAERELLKEERARSHSQSGDGPTMIIPTPTKPGLEHSNSIIEVQEALLSQVTYHEKLDILISLYSSTLDANLLPNVVVELYFLVQLLTARGGEVEDTFMYGDDVIEENYFSSVHNTVYFAVSVLEQRKRLLRMLDKCTLRLLIENPRISAFSIDLLHYLEDCYDQAESKKAPAFPRSPIGSVSFQADTDNRKNFPSDKSFHLFRRQRDGFYELLREWEASRMNPNYNMAEMFGGRVRALIGVKTELANLIHFARLFQSQLIAMCKGDGSIRSSADEDNIALLSQLKRTNPEKFKRLQERFIKPLSLGGPCPSPTFPGMQEFFHDFILVAGSPVLNQHLCDTFTAKVLELNETTFTTHDDEDAATTNGDDEEKEVFCSVLLSLRLVGKFLGFVTFLPYQSPDRIPDSMEPTYISIRNKHMPPIDLLLCLRVAVREDRLTLAVPWVVEYLSMMDTLAPRLDHYQMVLYLILYIHRWLWGQLQEEMSFSHLVVITLISWLLETPMIPDGFFFSEIPDEALTDVAGHLPSLAGLDNRNFIDQTLFYTCCPYIGELKTLLAEFTVGASSKVSTVRKITPISADIPAKISLTDRQLQLQMEENFFHNHPVSMKRVVEFVADRTASNFIKKFRAGLLQESVADGKDRVMKQAVRLPEGSPSSKMKDRVTQVAYKVAQELCTSVKETALTEAPRYCKGRVPSLMSMLLPDDQSEIVVKMASAISERMADEKISTWIQKHVTVAMYQTEIIPDIEKVNKTISQQEENEKTVTQSTSNTVAAINQSTDTTMVTQSIDTPTMKQSSDKTTVTQSVHRVNQSNDGISHMTAVDHDETLKHPSELLIEFKDCLKRLSLRGRALSQEKIDGLLSEVEMTFSHRSDLLQAVQRNFIHLTLELLIQLLLQQHSSYTPALVGWCVRLWKSSLDDPSALHMIFSGRVILALQLAPDTQSVWKKYSELLQRLYEERMLPLQQIQENGHKFIPYMQDDGTVQELCRCLCALASRMGELERTDSLGSCLQLLYSQLPCEHCAEANLILHTLGITPSSAGVRDGGLEAIQETDDA